MVAFASTAVFRSAPLGCLSALALLASFLTGCEPQGPEQNRQVEGLKSDLEETKRRLSFVQNSLAAKDAELAVTTTAHETAKTGLADLEQAVNDRNALLSAAKIELDELKKREVFAFAEIAVLHQQGQTVQARSRYEKFITDHPRSPLVAPAKSALAQLTEVQREVAKQVERLDPKRREREFAKTFNEGYMTIQELAPVLKKRSLAQVLALLGKPNQTFNEGTEIGYMDRTVNPATGGRGMLVIGFDSGVVSTLRVEYAGRKMTP